MNAEELKQAVATAGENLARWRREMYPSAELCRLQCAALAQHAAEAFHAGTWRDVGELRGFLAPLLPDGETTRTPTRCAQDTEERLALAGELLARLPELFREAETPGTAEGGAVAVLDNPFFAAAVERFAPLTEQAAVLTVPTFADVCEALSHGDARFGILPLEDSAEGKLLHVYEQLDRFELRVSHTADIPYPDGTKTVRFALFYRTQPPTVTVSGEGMLECSLFGERRDGPVELLHAALASGLSLRRMDAVPAPYGEDGFFYHPVFRTSSGDARLFEAYLTLFMPRATVTGRYVHLS